MKIDITLISKINKYNMNWIKFKITNKYNRNNIAKQMNNYKVLTFRIICKNNHMHFFDPILNL